MTRRVWISIMRARVQKVWITLSITTVAAAFAILAFRVLSADAVYSGDISIKYLEARSLVASRFRSLDLPNRGGTLDPDRQFYPIRPPFVLMAGGERHAIFPPAAEAFDAVLVAMGDYRAMILASLVAIVIVLWMACRLTGGPGAAAIPVLLGFGTPLWFYATTGWEHASGVAFATAAFFIGARRETVGLREAALAGLLLGLGAALREEVLLLVPGLAFLLWLARRDFAGIIVAGLGVSVIMTLSSIAEVWWFHHPLAAHVLLNATQLLREVLHMAPASTPGLLMPPPLSWHDRYAQVIQSWWLGYSSSLAIAAFVVAWTLVIVLRQRREWRMPMLVMLAISIGLAVWDLWTLVGAPKVLPGLYRLSPFLIFALLPRLMKDGPARRWQLTAIVGAAAYMVLTFFGADVTGGKGFGPRVLLPILPLLVVAAWRNIYDHVRARRSADRWIGVAGLSLVACALAAEIGGALPAYVARNAEDAAVLNYVRAAPGQVVIADEPSTAQFLLPLYYRKTVLLADVQYRADALAANLMREQFSYVVVVSRRDPDARMRWPGFECTAAAQIGRFTVEQWRR